LASLIRRDVLVVIKLWNAHICTADVLHGHVPRLDLKMSLHIVCALTRDLQSVREGHVYFWYTLH
jgi:hypothetical protein